MLAKVALERFPFMGKLIRINPINFDYGFIESTDCEKLFSHFKNHQPKSRKFVQNDLDRHCLFLSGSSIIKARQEGLQWCFVDEIDWEGFKKPASSDAYIELRKRYLLSQADKVLLQWLTSHPSLYCQISDPILEELVRAKLRKIAVWSDDLKDVVSALKQSRHDFSPKLLQTCQLVSVKMPNLVEAGVLLDVFQVSQLSKIAPPVSSIDSMLSNEFGRRLFEWAITAVPNTQNFDNSYYGNKHAWAPSLATEIIQTGVAVNLLGRKWLTHLLSNNQSLQTTALDRLTSHPGEELIWLPMFSATQQFSWLIEKNRPNEALLLAVETGTQELVDLAIEWAAIAIDIESDGHRIWQVGIADNNSERTLYEARTNDDTATADDIDGIKLNIARKVLLVGHNLLAWDIPALRKIAPDFAENMVVWDTLLVSFLLDPSQKCFALGGQHQAKDDAAASYALFRKQAERIGLTKVLSTILLPEANTSSLLETVGLLLSSQPFPTRAVPSWLEKLREGAKKMACRQIFLPKELLKEVSWNPDEMLGGTPKPPVIQPIKSNSEDSNYWVLDIYYVALRAHNNHVEFRRDMIPYWLEQAPGVDAYLKYASALSVDSDTSIRFAPYADNLQKMGSTEALNSAIALLSTDRLLVEVTADNVKEFSPPTRHCQTPQLWQSNDGCTLEYLDAVTWRLDHKAPYWHHYRIISTEGTENTLQLSLPKNNSKPTLISWPDRVFLYPWSSNQFQYWCEVLERFHAIARNKRKRGEVFLLLLTSTTSQNFVQRLQQLLIAIDMGFDAKEHHSLAEQLR